MKEFLEKALRQNVIMTENKEVYKKLPLAYRGRYDIFTVETNGVLWMAIHPKDDVGLVMLLNKYPINGRNTCFPSITKGIPSSIIFSFI